ncbi:MAG: heme NO-binding domain-containing protein [Rubricoccaceae bacterium]|nr:heme NO-binding domain-containing protein [Rubricoccaceae bacterium]
MKGIIFNVVEEIVHRAHGEAAWDELLLDAGVGGAYTSLGSYPDADLYRIVEAASARLGMPPADVLRWIGREGISRFHDRYPELFEAHPDTRSFVLSLNGIIHPEVRKLYPGADVPDFAFDASTPGVLHMTYDSPRRLCAFAEGLIEGAALHYGEAVEFRQPACMHRGDPACVFVLQFQPLPVPTE